jgi:hypothetical protein
MRQDGSARGPTGSGWKRALWLKVVSFLIFLVVVFALCGALAWLAVQLPLGHGQ